MWHIPIFPKSCSSAADIILTKAIKIHMESPYHSQEQKVNGHDVYIKK